MRVLVTGVSTYWGGRLAQALEQDPASRRSSASAPTTRRCELERTEFVRVGLQHALLRRIVQAAEIDTVVDTRLVVDSLQASPRVAHETNVIGTMNILAACGGPDSPVRKVVFKSSAHYYGCEQDDPAYFTEAMRRPHPPRTRLESDIVEAEKAVEGFAERNPEVTVTVLRFCNALGPDQRTTHTRLFELPACRASSASTRATSSSTRTTSSACCASPSSATCRASTTPPATACWRCRRSPRCSAGRSPRSCRRGARSLAAAALRPVGVRVPAEVLNQLRYGRGLDNRKLKGAGYAFGYTSRETVLKHAEALRARPLRRDEGEPYRYEREVEEFLRWSPSVRRKGTV